MTDVRISLLLNILRTLWRNLTKSCVCIDIDLGWDCYASFFANITELWPFIDVEFRFRSIAWERIDGIWPNFAYALILIRSDYDCYASIFHIYNRVMALDWYWNFVFAQYIEKKLNEFDQILRMHWYVQDLGWDCYESIFAILYQSYGPWFMLEFRFRSVYWENNWCNLTKCCKCIAIYKV